MDNLSTVMDSELAPVTAGILESDIRLTKIKKKGSRPNGSIVFSVQSDSEYRYAKLKKKGRKAWIILGQKGDFGGETGGKKSSRYFVHFEMKSWHFLRVELYPDGWVHVFADDGVTPKASYKFPYAIEGKVGYRANNAYTRFDRFTVWNDSVLP